ncbi:hypothetical protein PCANC_20045 [Puccinia coronata f. sp. avenae]|uniref:Uncharacterized protein n=1 Tax=Puccinia coronata f. sp. avenae TaxID=200324 RepID=A0A2N5T197_9BASI|nr:hypothetical protein PCANC_20045 [Puccinia coronata f. sp. avenae]
MVLLGGSAMEEDPSLVNKEEILGGGAGDEAAIGKELMMEDAFGRGQMDIVGGFKQHKADKLTETHQRQPPASSRIPSETHTHTHEQDTDTSSMYHPRIRPPLPPPTTLLILLPLSDRSQPPANPLLAPLAPAASGPTTSAAARCPAIPPPSATTPCSSAPQPPPCSSATAPTCKPPGPLPPHPPPLPATQPNRSSTPTRSPASAHRPPHPLLGHCPCSPAYLLLSRPPATPQALPEPY